MTLTFELDLYSVKLNQRAKHLGQLGHLVLKIIARRHGHTQTYTRTHMQRTVCSTWTTKVVGKKET